MRIWNKSLILFLVSLSAGMAGNVMDDVLLLKKLNELEYIHHRDTIVQRGSAILPDLDKLATDENDWELALYASVCAEHIRRGADIDALVNYDWKQLPGTESLWNTPLPATGIPRGFEPFFRQKLIQDGLWFLYLEIYAGKQNIDSLSKYRLLYETIPRFVVECSQGDIRQTAARIAEQDVLRNTEDNSCSSKYLKAFSAFVEDGTYPQGIQYFLSHLRLNGHLRAWVLNDIKDIRTIEALYSQYSSDKLVLIALNQHLQTIRSITDTVSSNITVQQSSAPLALSATDPPSILPLAESLLVQEEGHPRRSPIVPTAVVIAALAGTAFLLLKRRRRP